MGRATQGVRIVKLQEGDTVTDLVKVHELDWRCCKLKIPNLFLLLKFWQCILLDIIPCRTNWFVCAPIA